MHKLARLADEQDLVHRCQDDEEEACDELVRRLRPMVHRLAMRFARGGGIEYEDLWQVAQMAIVKAIGRFDCSRGVKLATYAEATAVGEIKHHFRDCAWSVHVPRDLQELSVALRKAVTAVGNEIFREPTAADLADAMGEEESRASEALEAANAYRASSLDEPLTEDGGTMHGTLGDNDPGFAEADARLAMQSLYRHLPKRERVVVALRFHGGMTQAEIARHVGVSQMHVSRMLTTATDRMRTLLDEAA